MARLLRIEPALFSTDEHWLVFDDGRQYLRKIDREAHPSRSDFPTPMIRRDSIDPCRGMDGKIHESLSSYRRSLRSDGNPQGETYTEIGEQELPTIKPTFDRASRRDDIRAAIADVKNGNVPPLTVLED